MEPTNNPYNGERFKDDVKPRSIKGFNTRDVKVRRQSVGYLDNNYFGGRIVLQPRYFANDYTRVPPLATAPNLLNGRSISLELARKLAQVFSFIVSKLKVSSFWASTRALGIKETIVRLMPKSYSLNRGIFIDWQAFRKRSLTLFLTLVPLTILLVVYLEL